MTTATITTDRGKIVEFDVEIAKAGAEALVPQIQAAQADMQTRHAEALRVAARYARGPQSVATEQYRTEPGRIEATLVYLDEALAAALDSNLYAATMAVREAKNAFCGGQSQIGLAESLSIDAFSAWSAAVKAAKV